MTAPSGIAFRPATLDDVSTLRRWDEAEHVIASDPNDDWQWETELARTPSWREQWIATLDGRPLGFLQIIDPALEDSHYWGAIGTGFRAIDIWIGEAAELGKGYGTSMMRFAIDRCFASPDVRAIVIDPLASNVRAQRFYERLGFEFVDQRRFGEDDCRVMVLGRDGYERFGSTTREA